MWLLIKLEWLYGSVNIPVLTCTDNSSILFMSAGLITPAKETKHWKYKQIYYFCCQLVNLKALLMLWTSLNSLFGSAFTNIVFVAIALYTFKRYCTIASAIIFSHSCHSSFCRTATRQTFSTLWQSSWNFDYIYVKLLGIILNALVCAVASECISGANCTPRLPGTAPDSRGLGFIFVKLTLVYKTVDCGWSKRPRDIV